MAHAGVGVKEIRLGGLALPPELQLARQREQLAGCALPCISSNNRPTSSFRRRSGRKATPNAHYPKNDLRAGSRMRRLRARIACRYRGGSGRCPHCASQAEFFVSFKLPKVHVVGGGGALDGPAAMLGSFARPAYAAAGKRQRKALLRIVEEGLIFSADILLRSAAAVPGRQRPVPTCEACR
jgi:hypothetical protein